MNAQANLSIERKIYEYANFIIKFFDKIYDKINMRKKAKLNKDVKIYGNGN